MQFADHKRILLVGAGGKTGIAYGQLLHHDGKAVAAYDARPETLNDHPLSADERFRIVAEEAFSSGSVLDNVDAVTLSPGVPLRQSIFERAESRGIPIFSELEYCWPRLAHLNWVAVTGTDGKSTTVHILAQLLNAVAGKAVACGNYGLPFSQLLLDSRQEDLQYLAAELSSYQLELCRNLHPRVAIYLNLAPDHLNRYDNLADYGRTKWNIARNLNASGRLLIDWRLLPGNDNPWGSDHPLHEISLATEQVIALNADKLEGRYFRLQETEAGFLVQKKRTAGWSDLLHGDRIRLRGRHNFLNLLFALEALAVFRSDGTLNKDAELTTALLNLQGLPHRFEIIETPSDDVFINDSKATTTQATLTALANVTEPLFLFMGGQGKGENYQVLVQSLQTSNAHVFLFGAERDTMFTALAAADVKVAGRYEDLEAAFDAACQLKREKQYEKVTYLLSPAATSWDQYGSFEERGEHFRKLVKNQAKATV